MTWFLNVTTSLNWKRPPVGIVRVEVEVTRHLLSSYGEKIVLCAWDSDTRTFYNIDSRHYLVHIKNLENNMPTAGTFLQGECLFRPFDTLLTMGLDWDLCFTSDLIRIKKKKGISIIGCCYDIIPVLYPHYCVGDVSKFFGEYFLDLASLVDHILCISKSSERDLVSFLVSSGMSTLPSTSVFELGDSIVSNSSIHATASDFSPASLGINGEFILLVSTIERRKNHQTAYLAYRKVIAEGLVPREQLPILVFVGMKGWGTSDLLNDISLDPIVKGKILIFDHLSDQELAMLYKNCLFTLYPSFYEGWGLPVAESLCYGKPVICSHSSSLPEVGGDLAIYTDPYSATDYATKIAHLCNNRSEIDVISHDILSRYKPRCWSATGKQVATQLVNISNANRSSTFSRQLFCGHEMSSYGGIYHGSNLIIPHGTSGLVMFGPHISVPPGGLCVELTFSIPRIEDLYGVARLVADGQVIYAIEFHDLLKSSTKLTGENCEHRYCFRFPTSTLNEFCHAFELLVDIKSLGEYIQFEIVHIQVSVPLELLSSDSEPHCELSLIARINKLIRSDRYEEALPILLGAQDGVLPLLYDQKLKELRAHIST